MSLYQVVMRLARNPGHPDGDGGHGYIVVAPLDAADYLDPKEWRHCRADCTVVRFKPGHPHDADGWLAHNGTHWFFHYDEPEEGEDEPVFRLGDHRLAIGDYVTIHEGGGESLTYRITQRTPFRPPAHSAGGGKRVTRENVK
ncbi:MAG TPA: hypothetical protein VG942_03810 [Hyphomonadaceae bacterium]|nr:hypothetical protein [Hyphomonadaceae bacterium]